MSKRTSPEYFAMQAVTAFQAAAQNPTTPRLIPSPYNGDPVFLGIDNNAADGFWTIPEAAALRAKYKRADRPARKAVLFDGIANLAVEVGILPKAVALPTPGKKKTKKPRHRKRQVTDKQLEAIKAFDECGNFAKAAERLRVDPKTVRQHYEAGMANAGDLARKLLKPKTHPLESQSRDGKRRQLPVAGKDDGPASIGPRGRQLRDER
jgi:hypothetical protein